MRKQTEVEHGKKTSFKNIMYIIIDGSEKEICQKGKK